MPTEMYIKNMVCDRCKATVKRLLKENGAEIHNVQLGKVTFKPLAGFDSSNFKQALAKNGFALIENPDIKLAERIKIKLIELVDQGDSTQTISSYLTQSMGKDYSVLSKIFKKTERKTIEKYVIQLKIEKAKELIQMQEHSFSEIAYQLGYNSISHLSGQFKTTTGMTMSDYQKTGHWNRSPLDKIL